MISFGRQMKISVVTLVIQPALRNLQKFENFRIFNEQWFKMSNFNSIKPFEKASEPLPDIFIYFHAIQQIIYSAENFLPIPSYKSFDSLKNQIL